LISKKGNGSSQPRNKQLNWRRVRRYNRNSKKLGAKKGDSIPQSKSEPPSSDSIQQVVEESPTPNPPKTTEFKIVSKIVRSTRQTSLESRISGGKTEIVKPLPGNGRNGRE